MYIYTSLAFKGLKKQKSGNLKIWRCLILDPGDSANCTGDWEIHSVSGRLSDNPGDLA